jgi:hypothetical protein
MPEGTKLIQIARDGMVLVVALNNLPKPFTYLRWRFMLPEDQFCFYRSQLRHHPLAGRFAPYDEAPVAPTLSTIMREAQERKGLWFSLYGTLCVVATLEFIQHHFSASLGEFVGDSERQRAVLVRNPWNLRQVESKDLC